MAVLPAAVARPVAEESALRRFQDVAGNIAYVEKRRVGADGGLIRDNITDSNAGVPLLKDIPGIGFLFGRQKAVKTREEVIMLIQPYVLESDADAREVTEKLRAMLSKTLACSDRPGACRME